jgi:hypothetical protein
MKLFSFLEFILEKIDKKVPLQWSDTFNQILLKIDSPISRAFIEMRYEDSDVTLIHISDKEDIVSFTNSSKIYDTFQLDLHKGLSKLFLRPLRSSDAKIYNENRVQIKIGRLVKKLFLDTFSDSEIEDFVSQYKSQFEKKQIGFILSDDIKYGYDSTNFTFEFGSSNELMNSCMNDRLNLIDFYYSCPVQLLMLVDNKNYIWGRALVWKLDDIIFMDRVYSINTEMYYKFINYAKSNNWWWKEKNKSGINIKWTNGKLVKEMRKEVNLPFNFEEYREFGVPYLDTFVFAQENKLMNYEPPGLSFECNDSDGSSFINRNW